MSCKSCRKLFAGSQTNDRKHFDHRAWVRKGGFDCVGGESALYFRLCINSSQD